MNFPEDYPYSPPQFKFSPPLFHPNIYKDGRLCISILHRGGDATSGEQDEETWSPVQTVESVLISIISLLSDPNLSSPANVDASVLYKQDPEKFKARVDEEVEQSKKNIPQGFVMPNSTAAYVAPSSRGTSGGDKDEDGAVDDDFWYESEDSDDADGDEGSFGSDSEEEEEDKGDDHEEDDDSS